MNVYRGMKCLYPLDGETITLRDSHQKNDLADTIVRRLGHWRVGKQMAESLYHGFPEPHNKEGVVVDVEEENIWILAKHDFKWCIVLAEYICE